MAKSLMIQGTASGVGKTILTLALCRIFKQDGYSVAPFKAQNMTNNTCLTANREEIAISQWLQALAAGAEPTPDMNPIILKPSPQKSTQVILNGKHFDNINAYNFKEIKQKLVPEIMSAYIRLCNKYDVIIIEGAGSPVELNLNKDDIVNMGMAKRAKSPVILVSDIDRGGIFASLFGTISLMDETEKNYVKATIVNRFKGEPSYFADGVKILADITNRPVAGVIPYTEINLPEEDGLFDNDVSFEPSTDFEAQFNHIAENVRKSLDMELIHKILEEGVE
ncbi:MAG: cobyric acid synthase [Defluviitaleaceae bacterium]|nr:cobyric acid synthase [Defluviitaleaceae bacterium]MCL2238965.1 cobyric acid synthase [Defluviitaleaceae bacterium]